MNLIRLIFKIDKVKINYLIIIIYFLFIFVNLVTFNFNFYYFLFNKSVLLLIFTYIFLIKSINRINISYFLLKFNKENNNYFLISLKKKEGKVNLKINKLFFLFICYFLILLVIGSLIIINNLNLLVSELTVTYLEYYLLFLSILPSYFLFYKKSEVESNLKNIIKNSKFYLSKESNKLNNVYLYAILPSLFISFNELDAKIDEKYFEYHEFSPYYEKNGLRSLLFHDYRVNPTDEVIEHLVWIYEGLNKLTVSSLNEIFSESSLRLRSSQSSMLFNIPFSLCLEILSTKPDLMLEFKNSIYKLPLNPLLNGVELFNNSLNDPLPSNNTYIFCSKQIIEILTIIESTDGYNGLYSNYKNIVANYFSSFLSNPFKVGYSTVYDTKLADVPISISSIMLGIKEALFILNTEYNLANQRTIYLTNKINKLVKEYQLNSDIIIDIPAEAKKKLEDFLLQLMVNNKLTTDLKDKIDILIDNISRRR